ncbi:hypothetical protein W97_08140 [Coniosporium apollinis CBS 100218]|uniref:Uncharacterized protein n=1 Tax=Coniosporium apollinis (strain CBS 100218) TaxID=1168221 RepID=R7Z3Y4_CONA1|nr:uncharacterized protein W97_08140 [Coniosporium apollinis CBS 100218]EON68882.1 hypothetical protein W97_08140 [Coniosporium apollinis CBS 100218]
MSFDDPQSGIPNVRPITIFTSYMLLCLSLTILILRTLYLRFPIQSSSSSSSKQQTHRSSPIRSFKHVQLFATLAILSLGTTWYYMLCFFSLSYREWASTHDVTLGGDPELGLWLKDTQLFKEAWGTAVATPARFWWTQQIFFFTAVWSVFLGQEGHRRSIPHLWAFMLLGQVAAVSFASNLFFLAVSLGPIRQAQVPESAAAKPLTWTPPLILHALSLGITLISVASIPYFSNSSHFLAILSTPHLLLFVPPLLHRAVPRSWGVNCTSSSAADWYYANTYRIILLCALFLQAKVTMEALGQARGSWGIFEALYEHPAVSSVGWDVIMCWVSWCMWALTGGWEIGESKAERGILLKGD